MSFYFLEATAFVKLFVQEAGTEALIHLMESAEDNRKLISSSTPLEIYAAIRRRERSGDLSAENAGAALAVLRMESARMVQQPLNPAVLEAARELLDHTALRWTDALQLGAALAAREMFQGTPIVFVSSSQRMLEAAAKEGFEILDPALIEPVKDAAQEAEKPVEPHQD